MRLSALFLAITLLASASPAAAEDRDRVFQASTITALLQGVLDGETEYGAIMAEGDFGIGTFNGLDGEMIAFDRRFYQIKADGKAYPVDPALRTPFATVTYFDADERFEIKEKLDYKGLLEYLDAKFPAKNIPYAFRIDGEFETVKTRSVPPQTKPYPKLESVVKTQPVFELKKTVGTLVGFRFPEYMSGLCVPGYHFHFITAAKDAGGHVLALTLTSAIAAGDSSPRFDMRLPESPEFRDANLSVDKAALVKVEK